MKVTDQLNELRSLGTDELGNRLKQARRELYELRFKLAVGQLENNREVRKVRKDIARILTVMHENRNEEAAREPRAAQAATVAAGQPEEGAGAQVETRAQTAHEEEEEETSE